MLKWTKAQWDAAGRHVLTALGSALTMAVIMNLITAAQAGVLLEQATNFITALFGLIAVLGPIYAAWQAARSASPAAQVDEVAKNLGSGPVSQAANAIADPLSRDKIIQAVANMPEVKEVDLVDKSRANEIPSAKVV